MWFVWLYESFFFFDLILSGLSITSGKNKELKNILLGINTVKYCQIGQSLLKKNSILNLRIQWQ